ncbi:MAG: hypothetical protein WCI73_11585, partial [Phycisphaerae bacterium]
AVPGTGSYKPLCDQTIHRPLHGHGADLKSFLQLPAIGETGARPQVSGDDAAPKSREDLFPADWWPGNDFAMR